VPDQLAILRLAALVVFIGLVAVGLWLLDVVWWVVPPVMAGALLIAWTIEWVAWRSSLVTTVVRETTGPPTVAPPPPVEEPAPTEAFAPLAPRQLEAPPPSELEPRPEPAPQPKASLEPEPEPEPAPEPPPPPPPPEPVVAAPVQEEPPPIRAEPLRSRLLRLRSVPAPPPLPEPAAAAPANPSVVEFRPRTTEPRQWNLWDLERIAREEGREHPERREEWSYLFLHLRQFAHADGSLPTEFDGLVRESFADMLERPRGA
jgi:outer membrane biosynthesis protein TonB